MSFFLSPLIRQRFFDDSTGAPLAGGKLFTYAAGTTTPLGTYSNSTGTVNANPVVLDSNGYADVWIDPTLSYKFVLEDVNNNVLWTVDNISSPFEVTAWSSTISYTQGQIVEDSTGFGLFYVSLTNNNVNNALASSVSSWRRLGGNIRTVSTNQTSPTLLATDELVRSNSTSGNLIHTLPPCSTTSIGTKITVKDVGTGGNYTQVKGFSTDNVDNSNTWSTNLTGQAFATFENNGTSWDSLGVPALSVGTGQIANGAVGSNQIANGAVGSNQIANGAVGSAQVGASNYVLSTSSGAFNATSASFATAIGPVSITAVAGRPVLVQLQADGSGTQAILQTNGSGAFNWRITCRSGVIATGGIITGTTTWRAPPSVISFIDTGATAGTNTYTFDVQGDGTNTITVNHAVIALWQPGA